VARSKLNFVRGVRGKVIDRVVIDNDEYIELDLRFKDGTSLGISIETAGLKVRRVDLISWNKGDSHIIKELL
jgi:hypothetical protein